MAQGYGYQSSWKRLILMIPVRLESGIALEAIEQRGLLWQHVDLDLVGLFTSIRILLTKRELCHRSRMFIVTCLWYGVCGVACVVARQLLGSGGRPCNVHSPT